jgi:valyl-tRNA synthetase
MSKSKGNVVVPIDTLEQYGADAVRYWAAGGRPGTDTAFDVGQMKIGRRLAIKLLNVTKFVLGFGETRAADPALVIDPLDRSMLSDLADLVDEATVAFDTFDYARALERTEMFFWSFTDDHVELVKARAYGEFGEVRARSAHHALLLALSTIQRLFAPFLPFVTEEVWSWWRDGSIHRASWPDPSELRDAADGVGSLPRVVAAEVLGAVRRVKSEAKRPLRTEVIRASVTDSDDRLAVLGQVSDDVCAAGRISELVTVSGSALDVAAELASPEDG